MNRTKQPFFTMYILHATHTETVVSLDLGIFGGAGRDRTDDLLLAKQALSQLSYSPILAGLSRHTARRPVGLASPFGFGDCAL